jgi:hypothetical protein
MNGKHELRIPRARPRQRLTSRQGHSERPWLRYEPHAPEDALGILATLDRQRTGSDRVDPFAVEDHAETSEPHIDRDRLTGGVGEDEAKGLSLA